MTWKRIGLVIPKLSREQYRQVYDKGFEATYALFDTLQQAIETLEKRVFPLKFCNGTENGTNL